MNTYGRLCGESGRPAVVSGGSREQWKAFLATFFGRLLDGFDFTILTFILIDVQNSFAIDRALAGALGMGTLIFLLVGGMTTSGAMALCIATSGLLVAAMIWMGPETRGRQVTATDESSIAGEGCS